MSTTNPSSAGTKLLTISLVVAALYFARDVFIPLALAVLFSFLLSPVVTVFQRWHLGRIPSVFIAVLFAFAMLGLVGAFVANQMGDLAHKLPEYQQNIRKKLQSVGTVGGGELGRVIKSVEQLRQAVTPPALTNAPAGVPAHSEKPVPVEVQNSSLSPLHIVRTVLSSLFSLLGTLFIVVVFVIFMLIERDDLRNRLIRLLGDGQPDASAQLLDDASQRVSRYLLMQLIVNVSYGILIGLGLLFIGIPNPLLWGALTALSRYIPYAGVWIAMLLPFSLGLAVDPNWAKPLMVLGLFAVVEITVANVVEPWLYGASTGITALAVLVAAVFWTWLWGPVGLLLSTPLTVCLVSVARYLPNMRFIIVLLGDEPGAAPVRHQLRGNSSSGPASS